MKYLCRIFFIVAAMASLVLSGHATVLVNDTWQDGTRTDPAPPIYSENGTNLDPSQDTDLESAWFNGGSGASATASPGHLVFTMGSSSGSWTTYFTPTNAPVTLASAGDQLKVTWVFTPTNVNLSNTSQGFPVALVKSPPTVRLTSDNSPSSAAYTGYGVFMNMAQTLGNSNPFQLVKRDGSSDALLSSSGNPPWIPLSNGATNGNHGYDSGTNYTFVMTITRNATNGLDVVATMTGGSLNSNGVASASYTDATPSGNSYTFDTFALRPNTVAKSASAFDTTLFKVEFIPGATSPSISIDPQDETAFVGQDASFNVLASGTAPLFYQWYSTNAPVADATNSTLVLTNVQLSDSGGYSALVSNAYGSVTSAVAQLTVSIPDPPSIITQPQDQTNILLGASATFSVAAGGSEPLSYQWYYNTSALLTNATDSTLTIANVQVTDAGSYSVVVNNLAGSVTSSNAHLTVDTSPVAPVFTTQPASQVVLAGSTATFTAAAAGTAPISYQWSKNGTPIQGATSSTLTLISVQSADDGSYTVTASNSVGTATSDAAVLTVTTAVPVVNTAYNLVGFGQGTTGGGVLPDTDPNYAKVYTATDFSTAILSKTVKIIEIMNDLNLGFNEIPAAAKAGSEPFRADITPLLHPDLLTNGVSLIDIQKKNGLTIFSANGATIRHAHLNIKASSNIIVRNLKFDELWEWDENSKGGYKRNNWDFMTIGDAGSVTSLWIDHCTFTKSYDGLVDIKNGSAGITLSWCKYTGDDGATNANSWVWQQINYLEQSRSSYTMYNFLRSNGFSTTDIVTIVQGHDKTHLIGANSLDAANALHTVTLHHEWFINAWSRLPRLRAGNVHNYNIYVDDTVELAAKSLRDTRAAAMPVANQGTLNNAYKFDPSLHGTASTENGATLVEKSVYIDCSSPLRNNETDTTKPIYTGKIMALDTIYQMDSTVIRGNSTDPGNPLGPGPDQAAIIPFSWNLTGNQLPYTYSMDDPAQLGSIVTSPTAGAGAGVLTWAKINWLVTSYAPSVPIISADPQNQTVTNGQSASFNVIAYGSAPLTYQWYFNASTPIANATNISFTLTSVQAPDVGTYSVVVSNSAGTATSALATLSLSSPATPFQNWQMRYFNCTDCPQAAATADPDGDGMNNEAEFLSGTNPTNSASVLRIISAAQQGTNVVINWVTGAGRTNAVQATAGDANGSYSTNFSNVSGLIIIPGIDVDVATNYVDVGGATNTPARYYRIRLVP